MINKVLAAIDSGLSGSGLMGAADKATHMPAADTVGDAAARSLEETVRHASELIRQGLELTGKTFGQAVDAASDKVFQGSAETGRALVPDSQVLGQSVFSWSGYFQAIGILCLLLGGLWFAVWLIRRYGKFNFLPRPGSLPRDALVMEAQMPLGPRKGLMVVRFLNRRLLLGVTERNITLLAEERTQDERHEHNFQGIMEEAGKANAASGIDGPFA